MPNIFFQGAEIYMSSGNGASVAHVQRAQNCSIGYQIPRVNLPVLGRFKPLANRPVVNYTPVTASIEYVKGNKDTERNLGLLNSQGVAIIPGASVDISTTGARDLQVWLAPNTSQNYAGQLNLSTGVLNSFSMGGAVNDPVKCSYSMEFFDLKPAENNASRTAPEYGANIIKNENMTLTGIDFTGIGFSGIIPQSFKLDINFNRVSTFRLGTKYPERRITDATATLAIQGFIEGITTQTPGLTGYDCGTPLTGLYSIKLLPSCSSEPLTTIEMVNPYLESVNLGIQVGNYISADLQFSVPLSTQVNEVSNGSSNLTIT
jgi:hypothetical protein